MQMEEEKVQELPCKTHWRPSQTNKKYVNSMHTEKVLGLDTSTRITKMHMEEVKAESTRITRQNPLKTIPDQRKVREFQE